MTAAIRKATRDEAPALAAVMARAFYDDPVFTWFFPNPRKRLAQSRRYFADRTRILMRQEEIYTVDGLPAAAMWARPGEWRDPPLAVLRQLFTFAPAMGRRIPGALRGLREIEERHPSKPHWYLSVLGTDPPRQGEGLGSALLRPVLDECDRLEIPAYLETSTERNVAFYIRHGFKVADELTLPHGPPMWFMWRE